MIKLPLKCTLCLGDMVREQIWGIWATKYKCETCGEVLWMDTEE
jgi:ribosomal protein S27E